MIDKLIIKVKCPGWLSQEKEGGKVWTRNYTDCIECVHFCDEGIITTELNLNQLVIFNWVKENVVIDRDTFRSVVSEYIPTIAEDSQQPEWSQGELDKCYDELMARNPIKLKDVEDKA